MVRAGGGDDVILRRFRRTRLQQLLQLALRIFNRRYYAQFAERRAEFAQDEPARGIETAVQKNGAQQGLKRIRQRGRAFPAATRLLAAAENQVHANPKCPGVFGQRTAVDELGPRLGQGTFVESGIFVV